MRRALMCAMTGLIGIQQMRIAVNIPAYRLDVYVADSLTRSMKIAPGMPAHPTPRGTFAITSVEWNRGGFRPTVRGLPSSARCVPVRRIRWSA